MTLLPHTNYNSLHQPSIMWTFSFVTTEKHRKWMEGSEIYLHGNVKISISSTTIVDNIPSPEGLLLLNMLDKSVSLTSTYLHFCARKQLNAPAVDFCPHLGARKRLDAPAGDFCPHLASRKRLDAPAGDFCSDLGARHARNRLDAPAGDTVDQSVVFSHSIGFPSLGCKTVY